MINQSNYDETKKSASAIITGYFSGDFESFSEKRANLYKENKFNYSANESRNLITSSVDDNSLTAYKICIESRSELTALLTKSPSQKIVTMRVRFEPKSPIPNPNPLVIQVIGGEAFGVISEQKYKIVEPSVGPGEKVYIFKRVPKSEFVAVVQMPSMNRVANDISLPPPAVFNKVLIARGVSADGGPMHIDQPAGAPVGKSAGPVQTCVNASSISFSETRPGCFASKIALANQSKVCFNVTLSINAGDSCDVNWTVATKEQRTIMVLQQ